MKLLKLASMMFMFFLTLGVSCSFYSCSEDEYETEKDLPTEEDSTTDDDTSGNDSEDVDTRVECRYCQGSGDCPGSNCNNGKCIRCGGKGYTYVGKYKNICPWCEGGKCPACNGRGKCPKCNGRGYN